MTAGKHYPSESREFRDPVTGARLRQVTSHPSIHHHPFYYIPAHDDAGRFLFFVSHRTGRPEIFAEIRESGELVQLTEIEDLGEWSIHPTHDGRHVCFMAGTKACRVGTEDFKVEVLADFGDVTLREKGMVGAAMGTTTLSRDDRWWAVPVKVGDRSQFHLIDLHSGKDTLFLECGTIGHPQFHPDDPTLLRYAGPYHSRIWVVRTDGSDNHLVYERDASRREWIVHETWLPGTHEILTTNWPHGMFGIDVLTGVTRPVCSFNAWHPMVDRTGTRAVADTNFPDIGLQLFDPRDGVGAPIPLCATRSSNEGKHWDTDHCPYDDGPVKVYAPQHTHPHPNFSPDGKKVVFSSDDGGYAQIYEVEVEES